jgi:hypothetical protein
MWVRQTLRQADIVVFIEYVSTSPNFTRARKLIGRCRLRAARRACIRALEDEPNNYRAICLKARLDVALDRMSLDQAKILLAGLMLEHPDDVYLKINAAALLIRGSDRSEAIAELRALTAEHADVPAVHQALAGLLGAEKTTWEDAWTHYRVALEFGPLTATAYMTSAYTLAKRVDPSHARKALQGAGVAEGAAVRTRALGMNLLFLIFGIAAIPGCVLIYDGSAWGIGLMGTATVWALWVVFTNYVAGCWKCSIAWLLLTSILWGYALILFGLSPNWDLRWLEWVGFVVVASCGIAAVALRSMAAKKKRVENVKSTAAQT